MENKIITTASIVLILVMLTSSCGWHLRGTTSLNHVDSVSGTRLAFALTADDIYTPMYRTFKSDYENRRVDLTNTDHQPQVKLLAENIKNRILSLNTELDPAESELVYVIRYQIGFPEKTPQFYEIQLFRTYTENKNRAVARDNEKTKLIDEMRHEAAEKILNQVRTLVTQQPTSP